MAWRPRARAQTAFGSPCRAAQLTPDAPERSRAQELGSGLLPAHYTATALIALLQALRIGEPGL